MIFSCPWSIWWSRAPDLLGNRMFNYIVWLSKAEWSSICSKAVLLVGKRYMLPWSTATCYPWPKWYAVYCHKWCARRKALSLISVQHLPYLVHRCCLSTLRPRASWPSWRRTCSLNMQLRVCYSWHKTFCLDYVVNSITATRWTATAK